MRKNMKIIEPDFEGCRERYRKKRKAEYMKNYYHTVIKPNNKKHNEEVNQKRREYYQAHKEHIKELSRTYYRRRKLREMQDTE